MPEELDPNKYHVLSPQKKRQLLLISVLVALIVLPTFALAYYKFAVTRPSQTEKEVTYEIHKGSSVLEIASDLKELGAINSDVLFVLYLMINGLDDKVQAGVYTIEAGTAIDQLANVFMHGVDDIQITFLEGWRVEEYAREATSKLQKIDYAEFVSLAKGREGYLFPDTYMVNKDISERDLVDLLVNTFENKTAEILTDDKLSSVGLSQEEAVIFASIVEREVHDPEDRPIVAGILINRWKSGQRLDADATVQYARAPWKVCAPEMQTDCFGSGADCQLTEEVLACLSDKEQSMDWWPQEITQNDLDFSSRYNTRNRAGLPPSPISNPGLGALESVVNYEDTDYNFYLTDLSGKTHYSETLQGHEENISNYLNR